MRLQQPARRIFVEIVVPAGPVTTEPATAKRAGARATGSIQHVRYVPRPT